MTWLRRYRIRSYLHNSIWILPVFGIVAALVFARFCFWVDSRAGLVGAADPGAARETLTTLAASIFTLIVFVSSALLLAVQLASAQLTPRVISLVFRDPVTKMALTLFAFTFTFALAVQANIKASVPLVAARVGAYGCVLSMAFFIYLIDHVGKFLRPSGILRVVASRGRKVIADVYPRPFDAAAATASDQITGEPTQSIMSTRGGVVLALDVKGLVSIAQRHDCVIEMAPQVGDFIAAEEPLFRIYHVGLDLPPKALHESVAVGSERTLEQDPAFVFRIIVDIASKGLSPAINDPTTAVLAIDQIHRLLRNVGNRKLDEGHVRDAKGRLRLVYRTPDWEDFVYLAVTEIRHFGGVSIQVTRRLRAMLENLIHTLPEERRHILRQELSRLKRSAERSFPEIDDQALADAGDSHGMGGKREKNPVA